MSFSDDFRRMSFSDEFRRMNLNAVQFRPYPWEPPWGLWGFPEGPWEPPRSLWKLSKEGLLALESKLQDVDDPFFSKGIQLVIDGFGAETVRDIMDLEADWQRQRHSTGKKLMDQMGSFAPAFVRPNSSPCRISGTPCDVRLMPISSFCRSRRRFSSPPLSQQLCEPSSSLK